MAGRVASGPDAPNALVAFRCGPTGPTGPDDTMEPTGTEEPAETDSTGEDGTVTTPGEEVAGEEFDNVDNPAEPTAVVEEAGEDLAGHRWRGPGLVAVGGLLVVGGAALTRSGPRHAAGRRRKAAHGKPDQLDLRRPGAPP